jgi:hypothetical protein
MKPWKLCATRVLRTVAALAVASLLLMSGGAQAAAADTQPPTAPSQLHIVQQWDTSAFLFAGTNRRTIRAPISSTPS